MTQAGATPTSKGFTPQFPDAPKKPLIILDVLFVFLYSLSGAVFSANLIGVMPLGYTRPLRCTTNIHVVVMT